MEHTVHAVYENGMFRPLEKLDLGEHQHVQLIVKADSDVGPQRASDRADPLAGVRCATGIPDLAEHFDDYRFGRRSK
jgi:predicted DNA-binding antitoxin AbrB/MazE fold protein